MTERYYDRNYVAYGRVRRILGERPSHWKPIARVKLNGKGRVELFSQFHLDFETCWLCEVSPLDRFDWDSLLECHHVTGHGCRSDERTALAMVCRRCHRERIPNHEVWLPRLLFKKWELDREELDWIRLTMIVGKHLPAPEPPAAGQTCWPWEAERERKLA